MLARAQLEPTDALLGLLGHHLAQGGKSLCSLDYGADSYALVVLDSNAVTRAQALATAAGFGAVVVWNRRPARAPRAPRKTGPKLLELHSWALQTQDLVALPDGQAVILVGTELYLLVPGQSAERGNTFYSQLTTSWCALRELEKRIASTSRRSGPIARRT